MNSPPQPGAHDEAALLAPVVAEHHGVDRERARLLDDAEVELQRSGPAGRAANSGSSTMAMRKVSMPASVHALS